MNGHHQLFELPKDKAQFDKLIARQDISVEDIEFSSTDTDGLVRHFVLVIYHERQPACVF